MTTTDSRRSEALNLPEDPACMPELDMDFDLSAFDLPSDTSRAPSILSSQTMGSSQTSIQGPQDEEPGLVLPSIDTPGDVGGFDANWGGGTSSVAKLASKTGADNILQESAIIEDPEFEIAEDGSIVALPSREERARQSAVPSATGEGRGASDSAVSARVRAEHAAGMADDQVSGHLDNGIKLTHQAQSRIRRRARVRGR